MSPKNSKVALTKIWCVMQMTSASIIGGRKSESRNFTCITSLKLICYMQPSVFRVLGVNLQHMFTYNFSILNMWTAFEDGLEIFINNSTLIFPKGYVWAR